MERLYEPAAESAERRPLWHVERDRAFFAGPLGHNAPHRHATPVLLTGLYGAFRLRIGGGDWRMAPAALIPAGTDYEFDMQGDPLAVLYMEPDLAGQDALQSVLRVSSEEGGVSIGRADTLPLFRDLFEAPDGHRWAALALSDFVAYVNRHTDTGIDPRIARLVELLSRDLTEQIPATTLAAHVGLSVSRMQHLFGETVGVPIRRYRIWRRLRAAIDETAKGSSGTRAAHAAGFFDQAHFVHAFRKTFGAAPGLASLRVR